MSFLPRTRGGALWRFLLAAFVVVLFTTATTAVAGLLQFKQFAKDLSFTPALSHARTTLAKPGKPQTLLLIGSDHRAGTPFSSSNTDTMMLVRMDADSSTINVLSIPRDLKVQLPQGGVVASAKLNSAYSIGGDNLLLKTIEEQVFPGLKVNHLVDVNFGGFEDLVNAIGCVYTDVDHRYYNDTAYTNYSSIDIQPGYQKLCGADALAFVRFRHTDTDIVRNARQQDFLRWAKSQFSSSTLVAQRDHLLRIFGAHTQTDHDLHTVDGLINLFNLIAFSAGHTVKQIPFPAILQACAPVVTATGQTAQTPCYVTADPGPLHRALHVLLAPTKAAPASTSTAKPASPAPAHSAPAPKAPLTGDLNDGKSQAHALGPISMPVYVPGQIAANSQYCATGTCTEGPVQNSYPRAYTIKGPGDIPYAAYRMTLVLNPGLGQYYGIQGTTWQNPPILGSPQETKSVAGKQLELFFNGHKLTQVAWKTSGGVYWVSNTLTDDLSNAQMVAIAASLTRAS